MEIKELNTSELDVAHEVLNIGLTKSGDSLSYFTKQKVFIQSIDFDKNNLSQIEPLIQNIQKGELTLLTTELKGELKGNCFLIFEEKEVEELLNVALPKSILDKPKMKLEMGEAILKELDNIVSASMITQLSNLLNCHVYGDVPQLDIIKTEHLHSVITDKTKFEYLFCFKTDFKVQNLELKPTFIWGLDARFLDGIKRIAKNDRELLENYKA